MKSTSLSDPLHSVHVYAQEHTSIYIYIYICILESGVLWGLRCCMEINDSGGFNTLNNCDDLSLSLAQSYGGKQWLATPLSPWRVNGHPTLPVEAYGIPVAISSER